MSKITVTAGHGGYAGKFDNGAVAKDGTTEASIATEMRGIIKYYLEKEGVTVITDGIGKQNLPLREAVKLIKGSKIAIEIHCNASANSKAKGVECLAKPHHKAISQKIAKAIADVMEIPLRGDKGYQPENAGQHSRLAYVSNGGIIVELFFISNSDELEIYRNKKWLIGKAIAGELLKYVS